MNDENTFYYPTEDLTKGRNIAIGDIWTLLTKPKEFFMSGIALTKEKYIYALMVLVGIDSYISKLDGKLLSGSGNSDFHIQITSLDWLIFFPLIILLGSISGMFMWYIGGWWYNLRLKWSGVKNFIPDNGRAIFMYNSLTSALPAILYLIYQAFLYSNYYEASTSDGGFLEAILGMIVLVFVGVAIVNSYKSVVSLFEVRKGAATMWFLVLPSVWMFLAVVMGAIMAFAQI